jgi:hypothetical protein
VKLMHEDCLLTVAVDCYGESSIPTHQLQAAFTPAQRRAMAGDEQSS